MDDQTLMTPYLGAAVLAALALFFIMITARVRSSSGETKESFLVGNRTMKWIPLGSSIAATWLAAQVLFIVAEKGYQTGWVGVFWFSVPNVASLIVFGFIAKRVRRKYPKGFTLSSFVGSKSSRAVKHLYQGVLMSGETLQFATQLVAGGILVSMMTGLPLPLIVLVIGGVALAYSLRSGIKSTVLTDYIQMGLILGVLGSLAIWMTISAGSDIAAGVTGVTGEFTSLIGGKGGEVFWSFGLPMGLGLLLGPLNDQAFWQRAWSVEEKDVRKSFFLGAGLFSIAPLTTAVLGFAAAGAKLDIADTQTTNIEALMNWLPWWTSIPFLVAVIAGAISTVDSQLSSVSSIVGHDWTPDPRNTVRNARIAMAVLTVAGISIALIPGNTVTKVFTLFATVRIIPSAITLYGVFGTRRIPPAAALWGLGGGAAVAIPLSAVGNFSDVPVLIPVASLWALLWPLGCLALGLRLNTQETSPEKLSKMLKL